MHPWAWWGWAVGVAVAASLTTNPWFLLLLVAAVVTVVLARRTRAPWARAVGAYLTLALVVVGFRLVVQVLLGVRDGSTVLFTLPELRLPEWALGVRLGGPVAAEPLLRSLYESLRLATVLVCVGGANALANPKRALRSVPAALYELSVAVTIALSIAPQLIESVARVRRARRLRGGRQRGWAAVRGVVIPVLEDAVERSLALARGMESRGFGRTRAGSVRRATSVLLLLGGLLVTAGIFALLGMTETVLPGRVAGVRAVDSLTWGLLLLGALLTGLGLRSGGRQLAVTHYRPDPWRAPEWLVLASGLACAACAVGLAAADPRGTTLLVTELAWPPLHPLALVAAAAAALPAVATPSPPDRAPIRRSPR